MKIIKTDNQDIELKWKMKGMVKRRLKKSKKGITMANSVAITIPKVLTKLISADNHYTYLYEHFEKIVMTAEEPPENITYKKMRLGDTNRKYPSNKKMEVPIKFFDTQTMDTATIIYKPNKKDYISNKKGLLTIETDGNNVRKHIQRIMKTDDKQIQYKKYINQTNALENIQFHQDIINILGEDKYYIYTYNNQTLISNIKPEIEHIVTIEEKIEEQLLKHKIIDNDTSLINYTLCLDEKDPVNDRTPKIVMTIE